MSEIAIGAIAVAMSTGLGRYGHRFTSIVLRARFGVGVCPGVPKHVALRMHAKFGLRLVGRWLGADLEAEALSSGRGVEIGLLAWPFGCSCSHCHVRGHSHGHDNADFTETWPRPWLWLYENAHVAAMATAMAMAMTSTCRGHGHGHGIAVCLRATAMATGLA